MKTHASEALPEIEILGTTLRIHFNRVDTVRYMNGESYTDICYDTAVGNTCMSRSELINCVIQTAYSTSDEIALLNNQLTKPVEFDAYQSYRLAAKKLADAAILAIQSLI